MRFSKIVSNQVQRRTGVVPNETKVLTSKTELYSAFFSVNWYLKPGISVVLRNTVVNTQNFQYGRRPVAKSRAFRRIYRIKEHKRREYVREWCGTLVERSQRMSVAIYRWFRSLEANGSRYAEHLWGGPRDSSRWFEREHARTLYRRPKASVSDPAAKPFVPFVIYWRRYGLITRFGTNQAWRAPVGIVEATWQCSRSVSFSCVQNLALSQLNASFHPIFHLLYTFLILHRCTELFYDRLGSCFSNVDGLASLLEGFRVWKDQLVNGSSSFLTVPGT